MKKVWSFMLCLALIVGLSTKMVAAEAAESECELQLRLVDSNVENLVAGQEYEVEVYFQEATNVDTMFFVLEYDEAVLEIVEDSLLGQNGWYDEGYNIDTRGWITIMLSGEATEDSAGSSILSLRVKVLEDTNYTTMQLTGINPAYMGEDLFIDGVSDAFILGKYDGVGLDLEDVSTHAIAEVPLNITYNQGFNALGITITYDNTVCTYTGMTIADNFRDKIDLDSIYEVPGEGKINAAFISMEDITELGQFATVTFEVVEGTEIDTTCEVELTMKQITNLAETEVDYSVSGAVITVIEEPYTLGDVNQDGTIDLTDAVYILLSYNEEKELTETQMKAADINLDGEVNLVDALQILKYFNGEISTLE